MTADAGQVVVPGHDIDWDPNVDRGQNVHVYIETSDLVLPRWRPETIKRYNEVLHASGPAVLAAVEADVAAFMSENAEQRQARFKEVIERLKAAQLRAAGTSENI